MLSNWNRSHTLILIMIVGLAGLLYYFGSNTFLQPLQAELDSTGQEIEMYQSQLKELTEQAQEADDELKQIVEQVPQDRSPDAVLNEIQHIADSSNVNIMSIASTSSNESDESAEEDSQLGKASYSLDVTGDKLNNVNAFLETVKSSEPFMRIDSLSINQGGSVDVSMDITTFYSDK